MLIALAVEVAAARPPSGIGRRNTLCRLSRAFCGALAPVPQEGHGRGGRSSRQREQRLVAGGSRAGHSLPLVQVLRDRGPCRAGVATPELPVRRRATGGTEAPAVGDTVSNDTRLMKPVLCRTRLRFHELAGPWQEGRSQRHQSWIAGPVMEVSVGRFSRRRSPRSPPTTLGLRCRWPPAFFPISNLNPASIVVGRLRRLTGRGPNPLRVGPPGVQLRPWVMACWRPDTVWAMALKSDGLSSSWSHSSWFRTYPSLRAIRSTPG